MTQGLSAVSTIRTSATDGRNPNRLPRNIAPTHPTTLWRKKYVLMKSAMGRKRRSTIPGETVITSGLAQYDVVVLSAGYLRSASGMLAKGRGRRCPRRSSACAWER